MTNPSTDNIHERKSSSVREKGSAPIAEPESKHDHFEISSSFVSLEKQEIAPGNERQQEMELQSEALPSHEAYEADLPMWRLFVIVGGLCSGLFMALMDMSIISTALYTISVDFKNYRQTIWAALSYILADIGCAVFFTRLADVFGRRQILLTSFFFFTCFSLACGFSQTVEQLILFRTLQGIGGTGLYSLAMVICPEIAPPKYLHLIVGILGFTIAVAGVMGPVLGGLITGTTTWRWIFWLNVSIGSVAIIILYLVWPSKHNITDIVDIPNFKQMDFFEAILSAIASICFVFVLEQVGTKEYSWDSPPTITLSTIAGVAIVTFAIWEFYISRGTISEWIMPHLPWRIVLHRPMAMAILSTILVGYVQFTAVFSIPLRAQIVDLDSPVKSGLRLLPLVSATAFGSLFGGGASANWNFTFYTMSIGCALVVIGTGLLSSLPSDSHRTDSQYGWEVILGLGVGMTVSTATFMNSLEVEFEDHAVAQGTVAQSRILGGAIAIAVSTIIMNNHIKAALEGIVSSEALQSLYISPFTILQYGLPAEIAFRGSYIKAFSEDMRIALYVSIAAFACSICAWHSNPPTVQERSELLAVAVKEYKESKKAERLRLQVVDGAV